MLDKEPLEIHITTKNGNKETIRCAALLRIIPGKREVYDAIWQNKPVIAKIFLDTLQAHRHLKREWDGLSKLKKLQINAPEPFSNGTTDDGKSVLVTEKITDSVSTLDVFKTAADKVQKLKLLETVCRELARENQSGVLQRDLHLGNFLIKNDVVHTLDVAQMLFLNRPLTKSQSISQLAFLASHFADDSNAVKKLGIEYFKARNWHFEKADEDALKKEIDRVRKRYIKKALKKSLRTSKNFLRIKSGQYSGIFNKSFIAETSPLDFIKRLDSLMNAGQILKRGNTSFVSRINFNNKDIVVKRYNHKGLIHSLRHTILRSRARRCWLNGHLLLMLNVATPKPVAFIEIHKGLILWQSYLITEYAEGPNLFNFLKDPNLSEDKKTQTFNQIKNLLDKMARFKITHSDLKPTNIFITNDGSLIADLDSLKVFHFKFAYNFYKNYHRKKIITV